MKDPRYARVKTLIEGKHITRFDQIVQDKNIPKSVVAKDLGMRYESFKLRLQDPGLLTFNELSLIASWVNLPVDVIIELVKTQKAAKTKKRS